MREIRPSSSEGGAGFKPLLLPLSTWPSIHDVGRVPRPGDRYRLSLAETGMLRIEADACHSAIKPFAAGTEGVMVEGVHARVLEALVWRPTIPAQVFATKAVCGHRQHFRSENGQDPVAAQPVPVIRDINE
jgi:hypothetical protein